VLPDFMVFLELAGAALVLARLRQLPFALLMVLLVPGLLALVFGWLASARACPACTFPSSPRP
jgi:urea transport system permease protein